MAFTLQELSDFWRDSCSKCKVNSLKLINLNAEQERANMNWKKRAEPPLHALLMLLMNGGPDFEAKEYKQIVHYFPPNREYMNAMELSSGIREFTAKLCERKCKSILIIYFVQQFIKDVTKFRKGEYYFNFELYSNWLMMYLDEETGKFAETMYKWCKMDKYIFFRESFEGDASIISIIHMHALKLSEIAPVTPDI